MLRLFPPVAAASFLTDLIYNSKSLRTLSFRRGWDAGGGGPEGGGGGGEMLKEVAEDDVRFSGTEASLREDPRSKSVLLLSVSGTASAREPRDYHQSCSAPCCDGCGVCIRQRWGLTRRYTHSSATSRAPQARRDRTSQLLPDAFTLPPHLHPVHPTSHHAHPTSTPPSHPHPPATQGWRLRGTGGEQEESRREAGRQSEGDLST